MGNSYGNYVMYIVSQLLAKQRGEAGLPSQSLKEMGVEAQKAMAGAEQKAGSQIFAEDETGCAWRKEHRVELLKEFCPEGYEMSKKHGHFIIGEEPLSKQGFIGVPGRFLLSEQPAVGATGFTLWQPLRGGELFYHSLEELSQSAGELPYYLFGYWLARVDGTTLEISEV